jgi:hypothetical protein
MRIVGIMLAVAFFGIGCGEERPGTDAGPDLADRGVHEGPVTKKDPDQGPVPDWVLALREAGLKDAGPGEAAPREAAPGDGAPSE